MLHKGLKCGGGGALRVPGAVSATCGRSGGGCRAPGAAPGEVALTLHVRRPADAAPLGRQPLLLAGSGEGAAATSGSGRLLPSRGSGEGAPKDEGASAAAAAHGSRSLVSYSEPCPGAVLYDSATGDPMPYGSITGPVYAGADQKLVGTATLSINQPSGGYMTFTLVRIPSPAFPSSPYWSSTEAMLWQLYTDAGSLGRDIDAPTCSRPNQMGRNFNHKDMTGNIGTASFVIPYSQLGLTTGSCERKRIFIIIKTGVANATAFLSWRYMTRSINEFPDLCTSPCAAEPGPAVARASQPATA
ncbi:hypothetical protein HYH02_009543 [Chlamydomonas schloesseri]|uniref:Pherophorin domain-containing protein n=1 Tax=Chlamydomonas schloesseri TaxID=2026947 RepID=A0A835TG50_9CHLO|nr:hypothetical protein HYH02_009543 [Chlamydomonas schloesseri]|eukprot:KAG2443132.1 hypothetical protein HYH02_009543 [Chlamydomonas schloesseri]